jgi:phosphonopyruvate decarboxylase
MIQGDDFIDAAAKAGIGFYTGVPCSFLTPLLNAVIGNASTRYVGATSEGEAVAIAAGAWLAGKTTAVMCQNSGLGNMVNPLTSLNWSFRIPTLLIVTWRGQPGLKDEPQHELMGEITGDLLDTMRIARAPFPSEPEAIAAALQTAAAHMDGAVLPYAFVLAKGAVADTRLRQSALPPREAITPAGVFCGGTPPRRVEVLERIAAALPAGAGIVATTGFCGRELYSLKDEPRNFYVVGSMGGASAIGLGAALNHPGEIVILDGDGAALMKLGNMATIGAQAPKNLTHIILDNGMHESTGGQMTVSAGVDFAAIAAAAGYAHVARADRLEDVEGLLAAALAVPGPRLLHMRVGPSNIANLPRPTVAPPDFARRFRDFLAGARAA